VTQKSEKRFNIYAHNWYLVGYSVARLVSETVVNGDAGDHVIHETTNAPDIAVFPHITRTIVVVISTHLQIHHSVIHSLSLHAVCIWITG